MPATAEEILLANDNASDYADKLMEDLEQVAAEDIDDLMNRLDNRNPELWAVLGVAPDLVVDDYDDVERDMRGLDWTEGLAGISAASTTQVFIEQRDETIIKPLAYREQTLGALVVTAPILVQAAKRAVEVEATKVYVKLQAKYLNDVKFIKAMDDVQLYDLLLETKSLRSFDKVVADQMGYVSRMTGLRPGDPRFNEEMSKLIEVNSGDYMKRQNRRTVERLYTKREIGGDTKSKMVWIVEGGPRTCSACHSNAGEIKTYEEWENYGLPGASTCFGGDRCRCHLAQI